MGRPSRGTAALASALCAGCLLAGASASLSCVRCSHKQHPIRATRPSMRIKEPPRADTDAAVWPSIVRGKIAFPGVAKSPRLRNAQASSLASQPPVPLSQRLSNVVLNEALLLVVLGVTVYAVLTVDISAWRGWYPWEILARIPEDNWASYEGAVAADPVPIKAVITGVTYFIGDWVAQAVQLRKEGRVWLDADRARLLRSTAVGLVLLGPLAHFYYEFVGTLTDWSVPAKILLDQTAYLALYNTVYYLPLGVLAGGDVGTVCADYRTKFWQLLTSGWKLWPLVGIVTYTLIPLNNRVLWIDLIEIFYSAVLSTVSNSKEGE